MIRELIAKRLGLHTEKSLQVAIYDKCKELRQILYEEHRIKTEGLAEKAMNMLKHHNPLHYRFLAVFPFVSKKDVFYWVIVKIPQNKPYRDCSRCVLWVTNPNLPSDEPAKLFFKVIENKATIEDIIVLKQRQGIGSYLLGLLEQLTARLGVEEITGILSPVDVIHRSAQVAFYQKNGYAVTLSLDKNNGGIRKIMKPHEYE